MVLDRKPCWSVREMTWSYSRVRSFETCPYQWFLKYLCGLAETPRFFSSYGSFLHRLIERHYRDGLDATALTREYITHFRQEVVGEAPSEKVFNNYFRAGLQYLSSFHPLPYQMIATEENVMFTIRGVPGTGFLDYRGLCETGGVLADHKSRALKQRSGRARPTKSDVELDDYLRQLYLYAEGVRQLYGELPARLSFNCFRTGTLIEEPLRKERLEEARDWFSRSVDRVVAAKEFRPNIDWFRCKYICGFSEVCEYFQMSGR